MNRYLAGFIDSLNLKPYQHFKIDGFSEEEFWFTEDGELKAEAYNATVFRAWSALFSGKYEIKTTYGVPFIPERGDTFYFVNQTLDICEGFLPEDIEGWEYFLRNTRCFHTEKEANEYRDFLRLLYKFTIDTPSNYRDSWFFFKYKDEVCISASGSFLYSGVFYFQSKQDLCEFVSLVGLTKVKLYLFNDVNPLTLAEKGLEASLFEEA